MTVVFLTTTGAGQIWTVPSDWNNSANTIEVIGGGGGGASGQQGLDYSGGGGGGAYSLISNLSLTPGNSITIQVGSGGAGVPPHIIMAVTAEIPGLTGLH